MSDDAMTTHMFGSAPPAPQETAGETRLTDDEAYCQWVQGIHPTPAAPTDNTALVEALDHYRDQLCEGFCGEAEWVDSAHSHPDMQRDCGGCRAAAALLCHQAALSTRPAEATSREIPSDGTCKECGCAPVNAQGLCATCVDERKGATSLEWGGAQHGITNLDEVELGKPVILRLWDNGGGASYFEPFTPTATDAAQQGES